MGTDAGAAGGAAGADDDVARQPMDITRDVFLTDARAPYFTLTLASRDLEAHGILSGLTAAEHERVADALTAAASAVVDVLRIARARDGGHAETTNFGCGT